MRERSLVRGVVQVEVDVVVIGAGAAGIAAGRTLAEAGCSFLVCEANERVGGRAETRTVAGLPLDLGCGWLHSADRNPWTRMAEQLGMTVDRTRPAWGKQYRDLGFPQAEQDAANDAYDALDERLRHAPPPSDRAADALDPSCPWNAYIEARSGYLNGAGLRQLSIRDYLAYDEAATDCNWRVPDGYGTLVATAAHGLPVRLGCSVSVIDHAGKRLRMACADCTITARAVVVTVSTAVIAREQLRFDPALPAKQEAAAALPLGLADKLFLALNGAEDLPADCHLLGNPRNPATGSYYLRPFGRPLIEVFFGGSGAEQLERQGPDAAVAFAREELAALLGSAFARRLQPLAQSAWRMAPLVGGSYSHALPGHSAARRALAEPVDGRIFFAGEACSASDFSTAHGAFETGVAAAREAIGALAG